jgi:hypothetical protein
LQVASPEDEDPPAETFDVGRRLRRAELRDEHVRLTAERLGCPCQVAAEREPEVPFQALPRLRGGEVVRIPEADDGGAPVVDLPGHPHPGCAEGVSHRGDRVGCGRRRTALL